MLRMNTTIEELYLEGLHISLVIDSLDNDIGEEGILAIADALKVNKTLKVLYLDCMGSIGTN